MLAIQENRLLMVIQDYHQLMDYLRKNKGLINDGRMASLVRRIEQANVLCEDELPWNVACLNSRVSIRDKMVRLDYTYTIVLPEQADHRKCKVSVFSPIGSALFGNKRGDEIFWHAPNGKRYFTITAVSRYVK